MIVLAILLFLILFGGISSLRFERPGGIGRGVPIWSEPLDIELADYLGSNYQKDSGLEEYLAKTLISRSFIRKEQNRLDSSRTKRSQ